MNYDQRIEYIRNWFRNDMLTRFTPPTGADPKAVAADTIEAVNNNIPSAILPEQMNSILSSLTKNVVQSAKSRTLPIVKDFVDQTRKSSQALRDGGSMAAPTEWRLDPYEVAARRIRAGEAVAESYLHGRQKERLMQQTGISNGDIQKYLDPAAYMQ